MNYQTKKTISRQREYEFDRIIKPEPIKGGQEQIDEGQK